MKKTTVKKLFKRTAIVIAVIVALLIALVGAIYIPAVQDSLVPFILGKVNDGSDMHIAVDRFRLSFPLDVSVSGVEITERGDTMLTVGGADIKVALLPLLAGDIDARGINIRDVYYKMGTPDSIMYLRVKASEAAIDHVKFAPATGHVDLDLLNLDGSIVDLDMKADTMPPTPPSDDVDFLIKAKRLSVSDVKFSMTMQDVIDRLDASLGSITADDASIDMARRLIKVDAVTADTLIASMFMPAEIVTDTSAPVDTFPTKPWAIDVNTFCLTGGDATYATTGASPRPGLDFDYLQASHIAIDVDSFAMVGTDMRVPLTHLYAIERSGLSLDASGIFEMDSTELRAIDFRVKTLASELTLNARYGMVDSLPALQPVVADIAAVIAPADLQIAFPNLKETIAALPKGRDILAGVKVDGTMADLHLRELYARMPNYWSLAARGDAVDITDFDNARGHFTLTGDLHNIDFAKRALDPATAKQINLAPLTLNGDVNLNRGVIDGSLKASAATGDIALDARWNNRREAYTIDLDADKFPVASFMPGLGVGDITANISVKGNGLDIFKPSTEIIAKADAIDVVYNHQHIKDISLNALLSDGNADISLTSHAPLADMTVKASGNLAGDTYDWVVDGSIANLDLQALGMTDSAMSVATRFTADASLQPRPNAVKARLNVPDIKLIMGTDRVAGSDINLDFAATDSTTEAELVNRDLKLTFSSAAGLDTLMARMSASTDLLMAALDSRRLDVIKLQQTLPPFDMTLNAGTNNILRDFVSTSGVTFRNLNVSLSNDSIIKIIASADRVSTESIRLDRIDFDATQRGENLNYRLLVDNQPGTLDQFAHVQANGYLADDKFSIFLKQQDISGQTGYSVGGVIAMTDSTLSLKFIPYKPTIAYKQWTVNKNNFILFNTRDMRLDADLTMESSESRLRLYTSGDSAAADSQAQRIFLKIDNIHISDWISLSPFAPPVKGDLSADLNFGIRDKRVNGQGVITLADFTYNKRRVGTFELSTDLSTTFDGVINAQAGLKVDGREVMNARGNLNDTTSVNPFDLDFSLTRFPLAIANPFTAPSASLDGYLNGDMCITGSLTDPKFDGFMAFDSASVNVAMLGTTFKFADDKVAVDSNVINFNRYPIYGVNDNPLTINGSIDARNLGRIAINLHAEADNMQVVGGKKRRGADVYGKAFVSLDAAVRGNLRFIMVDANVTVNSGTNVTYVMTDAATTLSSQSTEGLVTFVNFADTIDVAPVDTLPPMGMAMMVNALLNIESGSVVAVDLSADGQNKAQVQPSGSVEYTLSPMGDSRFTGRINIDGGFVRYTPPLMSEKLFNFENSSYVSFNGDMMNPTLNVTAVDKVLANVTQEGQNSRLINFDVTVKVTGTAEQMNVKFDLSTNDDVTVENELQSMSPEQRANQAMNLLLYNTYTGPGTKASSNLSGNPLYSFLESTVNSWMANNIKGVDISFGIDQYQRTYEGASSTATSYSYKVSKGFLDDRIKIVIGGNYSTDSDNDENIAESLISDISFEYYLNKTGTMYLRLFRHTGFESILEGEVTQTGVGFVFKRKLRTLRDIFSRFRRQTDTVPPLPTQQFGAPAQQPAVKPSATSTQPQDEK